MRSRSLVVAIAALATAVASVTVAAPTPSVSAAGSCVVDSRTGYVWRCDHSFPTARARGSIALLGDSVLLGSSPSVSAPSLPDLLAAQEWGPIRMTTALGMRSTWSIPAVSAVSVVDKWKAEGVNPRVVVVNIGANYLGTCTPATAATCKQYVDALVNRILLRFPDTTIWWAKVVQKSYPSGAYTAGMLGWNRALDLAAAARPGRMVVWDWPTALAASGIRTDIGSIHPVSATEYVKRSRLIAAHVSDFTPASYIGPRIALPAADAGALEFVPQRDPPAAVLAATTLAANSATPIDVAAALPAVASPAGVVLTAAASAASAGEVRIFRCDQPTSPATSLFVAANQVRSTQVVVGFPSGTTNVCARSTVGVTLRLRVQGALAPSGGDTFLTGLPVAATAVASPTIPGLFEVSHPAFLATDSDAVAATVTVSGASGGGTLTLHDCGAAAPTVPTLAFAANAAASASAFVPVTGSKICMTTAFTGAAPTVQIGFTARFTTATNGARFRFATTPTRLLDLRPTVRRGGWVGRHVASQRIDVPAAPASAVALTGVVSVYGAKVAGDVVAHPSGTGGSSLTAVAFNATTAAASSTVTVNAGSTKVIALVMRKGNALTAFDVAGWWVP